MAPNADTVRPGTAVLIGGDVRGTVTANQIRAHADGSLYVASLEVAWWDGRTRRQEWLEPSEVDPAPDALPIGFSG